MANAWMGMANAWSRNVTIHLCNTSAVRNVAGHSDSTALPKHCGNSAGSCGTLVMTLISWVEMKSMRPWKGKCDALDSARNAVVTWPLVRN